MFVGILIQYSLKCLLWMLEQYMMVYCRGHRPFLPEGQNVSGLGARHPSQMK